MSTEVATAPPAPDNVDQPSRPRLVRFLIAHPHLVLVAVLIVLILVTGIVEPNYLSVNGLRNSALFATTNNQPNSDACFLGFSASPAAAGAAPPPLSCATTAVD